ncbi:hypothetical protein [Actinocrispum wychmicini]|uniref:DUF3558 domain-containing protein n=1 Tax=Actinocrispum wychmicini TaxID=1213861 RepID=A0A4R2J7V8_9PSEU|nr:hypothetical protein [Actinocrispum wychmicini]TCO52558.1 hypothetical protein EV192_112290 [Actinocrispum wychmicini]
MHGRFRLLALAVVGLAVATVAALLASRIRIGSVAGSPAAAPQTTIPETPSSEPADTESATSTESSTTSMFPPTSLTTSSSRQPPWSVTIAKRKTVATAPACATLITGAEVARLTGTTAAAEPADQGYCGFDLATGGNAAGVAMVVLTPSADTQRADAQSPEVTSFEGNTAYRTTSAASTCDLRIALTDDQSAPFRALWVTLVLNTATESTCPTVDKLAKIVFDKLPNG